ncbi:DUF1883 domain-containing protein [Nocardia gipuzkoensis]|uniref:DUF1883 domain-containing protein n=1 Tax=Nocardia gipuzkoensis TaxID=2749991 RepID=UPI00237ED261|nr:DUF1883 domain-containing protein [Nocardia gipuzkoensis]MDE1675283.1 DUF1883 domain-containing protein [Nocardia gipuzkoensis]
MKFQQFDLGRQKRGAVAVVTLRGNAANVRLMDSSNLQAYKNNRAHRYHGGLVKRSPHRMVIPRDGHWYVTVDLQGMRSSARVSAAVQVEPAPLPVARSATPAPLSGVRVERPPVSVAEEYGAWDVFISHASEDKNDIARPLSRALTELGVDVWFDEAELRIGDSLRRKIDQGLVRSAFGVVVFSPAFFAKGWPQYELDGIVTRSVAGEQNLLPIWHNMSGDEVRAQSPSLADKIARSTADFSIEEIAVEIAERVRPDLFQRPA